MPELPEVETVCQGLNQVTLAQEIRGGEVLLSRSIAYPVSVDEFLAGLKDRIIKGWHRRGKYLLAQLIKPDIATTDLSFPSTGVQSAPVGEMPEISPCSPVASGCDSQVSTDDNILAAGWLGVHLRMSGQLLWVNQAEPLQKHTRVRLFFGGDRELRFVDQRTFGKMWWVPPSEKPESIISGLEKLGPEPFDVEFSLEYLAKKLHNCQRSIKTILLDQSLVAGVGNIYADEALFLSGIRPETRASALNLAQIERLRVAIIQVLQASIEAGGTTFSSFLNVEGVNGNYSGVAWVYGRTGQPCRVCGTLIQRLKLTGRSSHFCPKCQ